MPNNNDSHIASLLNHNSSLAPEGNFSFARMFQAFCSCQFQPITWPHFCLSRCVITEVSWTKLCYMQLWSGYHGDACSIRTIGWRVRTHPLLERDIIDGDVPLDPGAADALEYHLCDGNGAQTK